MHELLADVNPLELTNLTAIATTENQGVVEWEVVFVDKEYNVPSSKLDQFDFSRYLFDAEELALTGAISFFDEKIELPSGEVTDLDKILFDSASTPRPFNVILDHELDVGVSTEISFRDCIILDKSGLEDSSEEGPPYDFAVREIE